MPCRNPYAVEMPEMQYANRLSRSRCSRRIFREDSLLVSKLLRSANALQRILVCVDATRCASCSAGGTIDAGLYEGDVSGDLVL